MKNKRNPVLDFLKLLACIMVVILHAVGVGSGTQEVIYLMGTYGIPLFFMVNGYLLANKNIGFNYVGRQTLRYIKFILIWSLIIGIPYAVKGKDIRIIADIFYGAIIGKEKLYHLWFLTALAVIYFFIAIAETIRKNIKADFVRKLNRGGVRMLLCCFIALTASFVLNLFLKKLLDAEIRDIIPAPFRIITNGSYFIIGRTFRSMLEEYNSKKAKSCKVCTAVILVFILHICLCLTSYILDIKWASSFYTYMPVVINCIIIFFLFMQHDCSTFIGKASPLFDKTIGIWVLHPFVLKVLEKAYTLLGRQPGLIVKCSMAVFSILICGCVVAIFKKNKYLKKCFVV